MNIKHKAQIDRSFVVVVVPIEFLLSGAIIGGMLGGLAVITFISCVFYLR